MPKRSLPFIIVLAATGLLQAPVFSADKQAAAPPFPVAGGFSRFVQTYSGINALTGFLSSALATFVVRHEFGGKSKARIGVFSFTDLLAGKVRQVDVQLSQAAFSRVPIGEAHLVTATPFQVQAFKRHGQRAGLRTPLLVKVDGQISQNDLTAALKTRKVADSLHMVKIELPGMGQQHLQFIEPEVALLPDTVKLKSAVVTAGASPDTGISLSVTGTPYIDGARVALKDLQIESPDIQSPGDFSRFVQPLVNPLVDFAKLDRSDHAFRLTALSVSDAKVSFSGNLVLAPKPSASSDGTQVAKRK